MAKRQPRTWHERDLKRRHFSRRRVISGVFAAIVATVLFFLILWGMFAIYTNVPSAG